MQKHKTNGQTYTISLTILYAPITADPTKVEKLSRSVLLSASDILPVKGYNTGIQTQRIVSCYLPKN